LRADAHRLASRRTILGPLCIDVFTQPASEHSGALDTTVHDFTKRVPALRLVGVGHRAKNARDFDVACEKRGKIGQEGLAELAQVEKRMLPG
jgi:hypothetical protein